MEQAAAAPLKKTPLDARHRAAGARMVAFSGWEMPLEYAGIAEEHLAVRTRAGLFDVSHMGEVEIAGKDALAAVQHVTSNDAARLAVGRAQYSALLTDRGTFLDDVMVYRLAPQHFLIVTNAANTSKAYAWIADRIGTYADAVVVDTSSRYALLALQGPRSAAALQPLTGVDLDALPAFAFATGEVAGVRATISRTGYTGEDGFEIFTPPQSADRVWQAILAADPAIGVVPAGLGARDTLRLEAALRLYGHEIDETTTPLEAGLERIVGWGKEAFIGLAALRAQKAQGVPRRLIGFELTDPGVARRGHAVFRGGAVTGTVTSGTITPFLKKAIGLAYVASADAAPGTELEIEIRARRPRARVVPLPFYRRTASRRP